MYVHLDPPVLEAEQEVTPSLTEDVSVSGAESSPALVSSFTVIILTVLTSVVRATPSSGLSYLKLHAVRVLS